VETVRRAHSKEAEGGTAEADGGDVNRPGVSEASFGVSTRSGRADRLALTVQPWPVSTGCWGSSAC